MGSRGITPRAQGSILGQARGAGWGGVWGEVQEGGDICTLIADSCCRMTESNTILKSNYLPIKNKLDQFTLCVHHSISH